MTVETKRVEARVAGRKMADELFELLPGILPDGHGSEYADALCEKLRAMLPQRKATEVKPEPLQPIARLGATVMLFGSHQGKTFDETPLEYLDWLCRSHEEFYKDLKAYLKHPELEPRRSAF